VAIRRRYGEGEVKALAAKAGKAQAQREQANLQLQQRFQKDMAMMDYQFKLAAEQRARAWELEKMEIASRNDFALEEKRRVEKQNLFETKVQKIREAEHMIGPEEVERLVLKARMEDLGISGMTEYQEAQIGMQQERMALERAKLESDPMYVAAQELKKAQQAAVTPAAAAVPGEAPVGGVTPQPAPVLGQAAFTKPVPLKDVSPADIPQDERGHFIVADPASGDRYTITPAELPTYIEKGFVTQPKTGKGWWNAFFPQIEAPSISKMPSGPIPGVGFGGTGYYNQPGTPQEPYDPGERVRRGLRQVGKLGTK